METLLTQLPAIISALGVIIAAWLSYRQYAKNRETDMKVELFKDEQERRAKRRSDHSAIVYGELWNVLYELDADRVYVIQPHPLGDEERLSVYYEVRRRGVQSMRDFIHNVRIADAARFNRTLCERDFVYYDNVEAIEDDYMRSVLSCYGCHSALIKKLRDNRYDRIGSVVCEFTRKPRLKEDEAEEVLNSAADNIQFILPDYIE